MAHLLYWFKTACILSHFTELHNIHSHERYVINVIKAVRIRWMGHVVIMKDKKDNAGYPRQLWMGCLVGEDEDQVAG